MKRNNELVEKIEKHLEEAPNEEVKALLEEYKKATYQEHKDRHEFYRDTVERMVNDFGFEDEKLAEKMASEHPTLQQSWMRCCFKFIKKMASKSCYDGRNERSVMMAKKMVDAVGDETGLPMI